MYALLASVLATLTLASPVALDRRAGGPIAQPIPATCSVKSPYALPPRFRPTNATLTPATTGPAVYAYYLDPSFSQVTNGNASSLLKSCEESCYGYGYTGKSCKSVYQAFDYPQPPIYGTPGGNPVVACLMFDRVLGPADFEPVPKSESGWKESLARNIVCPDS